jgi:hypothetical protein
MRFRFSRLGMKKAKLIQFLSLANRNPKIGGMCLGLIACLMMSPFVFFFSSYALYMLDGNRVDARIVASPTVVRTKFFTGYSYPVEYQDANGKHRSGAGLVREANLKTGDMIPMRYLRSDPARSRSENGLQGEWPTMVFAMITFLVFMGSVWSGVRGIRDIFRQLSEKAIASSVPEIPPLPTNETIR